MIRSDATDRLPPRIKHISIEFYLMEVLPGADDQEMHQDNGTNHFFWTYAIPLTKDTVQHGYTQFRDKPSLKVVPRGHMVAWDGREYHRGLANRATTTRIFLFASVFSGKDYNRETY